MKRLTSPVDATVAKRRKQQQSPRSSLLIDASASTVTASAANCDTDALLATSSDHVTPASLTPPTSSLSASVVLDNTGIVGLVASFLSFGTRSGKLLRDNSLLAFAATSRRTHSLVMRDGPWWKQQCLYLEMCRPLVPMDKWRSVA